MSHLRSDGTTRPLPAPLSARPTHPPQQGEGQHHGQEDHALQEPLTTAGTERPARPRPPNLVPLHSADGGPETPVPPEAGQSAVLECRAQYERCSILGVGFDLVSYQDVLDAVVDWRRREARHCVTLTPPHTVLLCHADPALRQATEKAALTLPDGVGIILAAGLLRYPHKGRVTGPVLMLQLCDWGRTEGLRHFFCGGLPGVADRLAEKLVDKFPGLQVAGTASPPFRSLSGEEEERLVEQINASVTDIVWVGLGSPKQEKWMAAHIGRIDAAALIGVGAAFDFHSGRVKWAPAWVRRAGIEWAYRLIKEPRRMWRRDVNGLVFLTKVLYQRLWGPGNHEAAGNGNGRGLKSEIRMSKSETSSKA